MDSWFDGLGLAALATATWLTQLTRLTLKQECESDYSCERIQDAIEDDAWVFGRVRRLGCVIKTHFFDDSYVENELGSDD